MFDIAEPGCPPGVHHIVYWSHGGRTSLENLISLCKARVVEPSDWIPYLHEHAAA